MLTFIAYIITAVVLVVEVLGLYLIYKGHKAGVLSVFATHTVMRHREKFWLAYDLLIVLMIIGCIWLDLAPISLTVFLIFGVAWNVWAYWQVRFKHKF